MGNMKQYELSDIDKTMPDQLVIFYLCYKLTPETNTSYLLKSLNKGLQNAIAQIPLIGGSLHFSAHTKKPVHVLAPNTTQPQRLQLQTRNHSADERFSLSQLARRSFVPKDLVRTILLPEGAFAEEKAAVITQGEIAPSPRPVCHVQANLVKEGLILAIAINHIVADLSAMDVFMSLLCRSSRAAARGGVMPRYTPDFNRTRFNNCLRDLQGRSKEELLQLLPNYRIVDPIKPTIAAATAKSAVDGDNNILEAPQPPPLRTRGAMYVITETAVQGLKQACWPLGEGVEYVTSFDCIVAMLWRCVTRVRVQRRQRQEGGEEGREEAPEAPEQGIGQRVMGTRLIFPVDIRHRSKDARGTAVNDGNKSNRTTTTDASYFGNAIAVAQAGSTTVSDLLSPPPSLSASPSRSNNLSLSHPASLIRRAIKSIRSPITSTSSAISSIASTSPLESLASLSKRLEHTTERLIYDIDTRNMDFMVTSWAGVDVRNYSLATDGTEGRKRLEAVRTWALEGAAGCAVLFPDCGGGDGDEELDEDCGTDGGADSESSDTIVDEKTMPRGNKVAGRTEQARARRMRKWEIFVVLVEEEQDLLAEDEKFRECFGAL